MRSAGLGISLAVTAHEDTAGLAISVPHPFFFNASATDATVTNGSLTRTEGAWRIDAMLVAVQAPHVRVRVFGGPSYFRAEQETVTGIKYEQVYQLFARGNVVDITSYTTQKSVGSAWGFHGGADVSASSIAYSASALPCASAAGPSSWTIMADRQIEKLVACRSAEG